MAKQISALFYDIFFLFHFFVFVLKKDTKYFGLEAQLQCLSIPKKYGQSHTCLQISGKIQSQTNLNCFFFFGKCIKGFWQWVLLTGNT